MTERDDHNRERRDYLSRGQLVARGWTQKSIDQQLWPPDWLQRSLYRGNPATELWSLSRAEAAEQSAFFTQRLADRSRRSERSLALFDARQAARDAAAARDASAVSITLSLEEAGHLREALECALDDDSEGGLSPAAVAVVDKVLGMISKPGRR